MFDLIFRLYLDQRVAALYCYTTIYAAHILPIAFAILLILDRLSLLYKIDRNIEWHAMVFRVTFYGCELCFLASTLGCYRRTQIKENCYRQRIKEVGVGGDDSLLSR